MTTTETASPFYRHALRSARRNMRPPTDPAEAEQQAWEDDLAPLIAHAVERKLNDMDNGCHDLVSSIHTIRPTEER